MEESKLALLSQRLDRIERGNRWLKALCGLSLLLIASLGVMAQAPRGGAHEIRARRFVVVDEKGKTRAELGRTGYSEPGGDALVGLNLFDESETSRARMTLWRCPVMKEGTLTVSDCPSLEFFTESPGYLQVRLEAGPSRGSSVELRLLSDKLAVLDPGGLEFTTGGKTTWRTRP